MPRLPIEYNETGLAVPQARGISLAQAGAAAGSAAAGAEQAGADLSRGAFAIAHVEAQKAKYAAGTEAMELFTNAAQRVEDLHLSLKTAPDADPQTHVARFEQGFKDIATEEVAKSDNPLVKQTAQKLLDRLKLESTLQARKDANAMFLDREKASVAQTLENMEKASAQATTPQGRTFYNGLAVGYLQSKRGVLTEQQIQKLSSDFIERTSINAAHQAIDADPFNAKLDTFTQGMDPQKVEQVQTYQFRAQQSALAAEAKREKEIERETEKQRKIAVDQYERLAMDGKLTVKELDYANDNRLVMGEDYRRIRTRIEKGPDRPSDPDVLTSLSARVHRSVPTVGQEELNRAQQTGKLSYPDWKELSDKLIARQDRNRAEGRAIAGEQRAIANTRQSQAEQILDRTLGISSPYDVLEKEDQKLQDLGLRELTARSSAYGGGEDPIAVATDIAKRIAPEREGRIRLKVSTLQSTLIYKTEGELEAARGSLSPQAYDVERQKFLQIKRILEKAPPPTATTPSTPSSRQLRPPGTPALSGKTNE